MNQSRLLILLPLSILGLTIQAAPIQGIHFSHNDWEVTCDNTGTCRVAGYQSDADTNGVSLLLTRKAGAKQPITAEIQLLENETFQPTATLHMWIGDKNIGSIDYRQQPAKLDPKLINALIQSSKSDEPITFRSGEAQWQLSNKGMSAAFLKMDDFQKRIGTIGAISRKGALPEDNVLESQALPSLTIKKIDVDTTLAAYYLEQSDKINKILNTSDEATECDSKEPDQNESGSESESKLEIYPLNADQALVSRFCWRAAYNQGYAFWLIDKNLVSAKLITESGNGYDNGQISYGHKGRGLGDCWNIEQYSWNGSDFIKTKDEHTGMCRGQAGGFWQLPILDHAIINENEK